MSLIDRTNEEIALSQHQPLGGIPANLVVDVDFDSSFDPFEWVAINFTDIEHDSDMIKLTVAEALLLRDRLILILGLPTPLAESEAA